MKPLTTASVIKLLKRWYVVRLVTLEEDKRLTAKGLRFTMPAGWSGEDSFACYKAVGIEAEGRSKTLKLRRPPASSLARPMANV